jgi:tetratricopeptide (TPR) repeat protein
VRLLQQGGLAPRETHLATTDFWRTFPEWPVALLTFVVCGGLAVVVLGSKGFCSSACPYGGIFGVVDQLAPWRIRVDSSCNGCGHCTAVCTSNVKVHAEVREHGAVVDPGCMKCMDCVSSCPNGSLRVGFGLPALFAKARAATKGARQAAVKLDLPRHALRLGFALAAMALFHYYDGSLSAYANRAHWGVVALIGASAWLVALLFRSRAHKRRDCSLGDEALLAALFVAAMYAFRGLHDWFPFLLSLGWSSIVAWCGLALVRAARSGEYALQAVALRRAGRWTRAGALYGAACALLAAGTGLAAHEQWTLARSRTSFRAGVEAGARSDWDGARASFEHALRHDPDYRQARARLAFLQALEAAQSGDSAKALAGFEASLAADPAFAEARENLAGMLCAVGRLEEGLRLFEESLRISGPDPRTHALAARAALALAREDAAREHVEAGLRLAPLDPELLALRGELGARR